MSESHPLLLARWRRWIGWALACYWIALFIGTHMPMPELPDLPPHSDKGIHFGAYAGLAYLLGLWLWASRPFGGRHYLLVFGVVAAFGVADELLQIPVNRTADVYDWLADCLGAGVGLTALLATRLVHHCSSAARSS